MGVLGPRVFILGGALTVRKRKSGRVLYSFMHTERVLLVVISKNNESTWFSRGRSPYQVNHVNLMCLLCAWLCALDRLRECSIPSTYDSTSKENTTCIKIIENSVFHKQTKHIKVDHHFIHEALDDQTITLLHGFTVLQNADIFTKTLPNHHHFAAG